MRRIVMLGIAAAAATLLVVPTAGAVTGRAPTLAQWRDAARTGAITLPIEGRSARLVLGPNEILTPDARRHAARHGIDVAGIETYQGYVAGEPGSIAAITVSPSGVLGFVRTATGTFDVAATDRGGTLRRPAPSGRMIDTGVEAGAHFDCEGWVPGHYATGGLNGGDWGPRLEFDLAVAADQSYTKQWAKADGSWENDAIATVNAADVIYDQLNMDINLVDIHADTYAQSASSALLGEVRFHYRAYHPELDRDAVALLVYKEIGPLGQASCIGGAGLDDRANLVMTTNSAPFVFLGIEFYSNIYGKTLAHEMGHLLRAHHHYSNCVEATRQPITDACTLMTPFVDELDEVIGSVEAVVIRGWANDHL